MELDSVKNFENTKGVAGSGRQGENNGAMREISSVCVKEDMKDETIGGRSTGD